MIFVYMCQRKLKGSKKQHLIFFTSVDENEREQKSNPLIFVYIFEKNSRKLSECEKIAAAKNCHFKNDDVLLLNCCQDC